MSPRTSTALRLALVAVAVVAVVLVGRRAAPLVPAFTAWVEGLGAWGAAAFVLGYAVATVAFIPASLLTLAAGATFGIVQGVGLVVAGATLGASASFLITRYMARGAVERRLAREPRLAAIDRAVASDGRRIALLLRLSPVVPFGLLNYALGATRLGFRDFLVAMIGIVPGTTLYVYAGKTAGEVALAASGAAPARGPGYWAVLALGLGATLAVTVLVTRLARRALAESAVGERAAGVGDSLPISD